MALAWWFVSLATAAPEGEAQTISVRVPVEVPCPCAMEANRLTGEFDEAVRQRSTQVLSETVSFDSRL